MATTCFGPPPLPPNKKSLNFNRNRKLSQHSFLSSTYLSFRDPAEESEFVTSSSIIDDYDLFGYNNKRTRKLKPTNSFINKAKEPPSPTLTRSHSEGNLNRKNAAAPMTINKYIKVLSGSWKNLLSCK